jgi:hypothetical protein
MLEEQRLAAAGHLGDAIRDLGEFEVHLHGLRDAVQLADAVDRVDERGQVIERHRGAEKRRTRLARGGRDHGARPT